MKKFVPFLIFVLMFTGCGSENAEKQLPPPVKVIQLNETFQPPFDSYAGVVRGRYESNLAFQTSGRIINRRVAIGNFVRAGETLMEIDPKDALQQFNAGKAQVDSAKAQLNLAKSNFERYSQLFSENAISAAMLDQYKTNYENAVATYNAAIAQANQISNNLEYTQLISNADGVISSINAEIGQVVSAGQPVLTLVQTGELEVEINVPENKLSAVQIGTPAEISFWANSDKITGIVREISPMADSVARTYRVRISIPSNDNIKLGMTATATFKAFNLNNGEYTLPLSAIYQTGGNSQVWVVNDENRVVLKNIIVKNFSDNSVVVGGLSPNDKIVVAGVHKLFEGQEVRILEANNK